MSDSERLPSEEENLKENIKKILHHNEPRVREEDGSLSRVPFVPESFYDNAAKEIFELVRSEAQKVVNAKDRTIKTAIEIAFQFGQIDGGHHKMWVIDEMLKILAGAEYKNLIAEYEKGGKYEWNTGIAP